MHEIVPRAVFFRYLVLGFPTSIRKVIKVFLSVGGNIEVAWLTTLALLAPIHPRHFNSVPNRDFKVQR